MHVFNPVGFGDVPSTVRWSILAGCDDYATAIRRTADLLPQSTSPEAEHWFGKARTYLPVLLHAAAVAGRTVPDVMAWVRAIARDASAHVAELEIANALDLTPNADEKIALLNAFLSEPQNTKGSVISMITPALAWVSDDAARHIGAAPLDEVNFDARQLIIGRETLHVIGQNQAGGPMTPLTSAFVAEIAHHARLLAATMPGGRLDPPVTMLLDEAAIAVRLPLDQWSADFGGRGITLHISVQSLPAARAVLGPRGRRHPEGQHRHPHPVRRRQGRRRARRHLLPVRGAVAPGRHRGHQAAGEDARRPARRVGEGPRPDRGADLQHAARSGRRPQTRTRRRLRRPHPHRPRAQGLARRPPDRARPTSRRRTRPRHRPRGACRTSRRSSRDPPQPSPPAGRIDQDTVRAVVGRVDRLEADLAKLNHTVTGLGGAVKGLLAQKQEQAVQPDWLTVDKPAVAQTMLLAAVDWTERHGATLGLKVQPCWPWHPQAVAVLLAATQHHYAVYHGPSPVAVTDFLTRYLPAIAKQLREAQGSCREAIHLAAGRSTPSTATSSPTWPAGGPPTAPASPPA